ncbi:MAG: hypothetical protein U1E52_14670 [Geminicoccaceae bacterium]
MVFLSCLSMVSPLGYSVDSTCAALRAKISAFAELRYQDDLGEPIVGAIIPDLPWEMRGRARLVAIAQLVLESLDAELGSHLPWGHMPLILCTRESARPGPHLGGIVAELQFPHDTTFGGAQAVHIASGHVAAFEGVERARRLLAVDGEEACLILAVDSLIDARTLSWLDGNSRLKTSAQTDGIIPGEAGCLALATLRPHAPGHVVVKGIGLATEAATVLNDEPLRAEGLTVALREALREAGIGLHDVDFRLSDVAGESYAFEELVLAQTRLMRKVRPSQPLWHPADCIGDCGAAAGLVQLAWAGQAFQRDYAPGPLAALHGSSVFGARAAAVVGH